VRQSRTRSSATLHYGRPAVVNLGDNNSPALDGKSSAELIFGIPPIGRLPGPE
jgi:hypothetical protein